jgi:hypothetical protein
MTDIQTAIPAPALPLHDLIAWGETNANCKAFRFEPGTYGKISLARTDSQKELIAAIQLHNAISWGSALMVYSTSWGDAQLMGFNLYGPKCSYQKSVIDFLCSLDDQREMFAKFIEGDSVLNVTVDELAALPALRLEFARHYNGADEYTHVIEASLRHFGIPFTS